MGYKLNNLNWFCESCFEFYKHALGRGFEVKTITNQSGWNCCCGNYAKHLSYDLAEAIEKEVRKLLVEEIPIEIPKDLHPDSKELVIAFAEELAAKMRAAEEKYGYSNGWKNTDWMEELKRHFKNHIEKGDPRDVAVYCAFLWHHKQSTAG